MSMMMRILLGVVGILVTGGLFWYAAHGVDLTKNGQKLVRIVAVGIFVVIAIIVIFEKAI